MRRITVFSVALAAVALAGACSDKHEPTPVETVTPDHIEIADIDFVGNTYFFFNHPAVHLWGTDNQGHPVDLLLPDQHHSIDVYREVKPTDKLVDPELISIPGRAWVDPGGDGQSIVDVLAPLASGVFPADSADVKGEWELLTLGIDYWFVLDYETLQPIGLSLLRPIADAELRGLAVAYTNLAGDIVGGQRWNELLPPGQQLPANQDTTALELIKERVLHPTGGFGFLWEYMPRNVYRIGLTNIDPATFSLHIIDNLAPRDDPSRPEGSDVPYLRIFGLDRFDKDGNPGSDGLVDLTSGPVDLQSGTIVFPSLHPFAPSPEEVNSFTGGAFVFEGDYTAQYDTALALYTKRLSSVVKPRYHQYTIVIEAVGTPDTPASP